MKTITYKGVEYRLRYNAQGFLSCVRPIVLGLAQKALPKNHEAVLYAIKHFPRINSKEMQ